MKKKHSRLLILSVMLFLASIAMLQEMYIVSSFFSGIFGCLVGIIAMKEQEGFQMWSMGKVQLKDLGGLNEKSNKGQDAKKDVRQGRKNSNKRDA